MESPAAETDFDIGLKRMVEAFVTITWLALNLGLNFFNKWAFTPDDDNFDGAGFTFPIFFTMWNMVCAAAPRTPRFAQHEHPRSRRSRPSWEPMSSCCSHQPLARSASASSLTTSSA